MKKLRKVLAVVLAMAMVMGMSIMSFAAKKPIDTDSAEVTILGIETDDTIEIVKIIEAKYSTYGLGYYKWTDDSGKSGQVAFEDGKVVGLDRQYITDLAKNATGAEFENGSALGAGTYLVLVTAADSTIVYNPMVVSVYYAVDGTLVAGNVSANSNWTLETSGAYAKKSDVDKEFEKKVTNATHGGNKLTDTKDVQVGDTLSFEIKGVIPSYSAQYENPVYKIKDTLKNGLENYQDIVVKVNGAEVDTENATVTRNGDTGFEVNFDSAYISSLADKSEDERTVTITYKATVTEEASSINPATNEATITYSKTTNETKDATKTTKTYTFELDNNFTKVDENGEALGGATFTLYRDNSLQEIVDTATSDNKGNISFKGLDATTYYLKETTAPEGYQLNDTVYTVTITANYNENGDLRNYDVRITDPNNAGNTANHVNIQNTKLSELPSTGGIGTTIFTIVGCLLMIGAASFLFVSRRRADR